MLEPGEIIFDKSVTIRIHYDKLGLPEGITDDKTMLFIYGQNNYWELIPNSSPDGDYIKGDITFFGIIASGYLSDYVK